MPKYRKVHHEDIAAILKTAYARNRTGVNKANTTDEAIRNVEDLMVALFQADNPAFRRPRFTDASWNYDKWKFDNSKE